MPKTIILIDKLISTDSTLLIHPENQFHKHTFTCWKKQEDEDRHRCRFGAPFWPMKETQILLPTPKTDP